MGANNWFKCFPSDFLNGMSGLAPDERGIYASLIFMMYDQGGLLQYNKDPRKGNSRALAFQCGTSTRHFNKVVERLIEGGKIVEKNGYISNKRVFTGILPVFISEISLKYLILMFPKWRNYNDLAWRKKLDAIIQKKINNKKDLVLVGSHSSAPHDFEYAVSEAYGPSVWLSWFSRCEFDDGVIYPHSEFAGKKLELKYSQIISDHGFTIGEPRKAVANG